MYKRILAIWVAFLLLPGIAVADETCWTKDSDPYYHAYEHCQGAKDLYEADSYEVAWAGGKYKCPVCYQDATQYVGVEAVERGGTYVVRLPDEWMRSQETKGVFAASSEYVYTGTEAQQVLAEQLHGDRYVQFAQECEKTGSAEEKCYYPDFYPSNDEIFMSTRHIGGAWYVVLRPTKKYSGSICLRFFTGPMTWKNGELTTLQEDEYDDDNHKLKLNKLSGQGAVFEGERENLKYSIYDEMGVYIAVIREPGASGCEELLLNIDGFDTGIKLNGYMEGEDAVFVCTLTAAETNAMNIGASLVLSHTKE